MSTMASDTPKRRSRRQLSDEFKQEAVRLVLDEGKSMAAIGRELDLVPTALRDWRFASCIGRENLIAGTDCGFAQEEINRRVHPSIMWAKLEATAEGARIASRA